MSNPAGNSLVHPAASSGEIRQMPEENAQQPQRAMVIAQPSRIGLLRPIEPPEQVIESQEATRALIEQALKKGRDYGLIQGTQKETLFKAGAERVILAFGCYARFIVREKEIDHSIENRFSKSKRIYNNAFNGDRSFKVQEVDGISHGLYRYVIECEIVLRETGQIVGSFIGSASTMESKYIDRPRDCENTIIKMAEKRALVGAALTTFGLSDQFTQDVEDMPPEVRDRTANQAGDVADADDPESDWIVPFGDFKNTSIRQKNPDGSYVIANGDLVSSARWCTRKRNDEEKDSAGWKRMQSWLDGFEREIERRAAEAEKLQSEQQQQNESSSFESRYTTRFPMNGNLKGAKFDEAKNGDYIVSNSLLIEVESWADHRLAQKEGHADFVKPANRPKIEQLLIDVRAERARRAEAPPARIEDTASADDNAESLRAGAAKRESREGEKRSDPTKSPSSDAGSAENSSASVAEKSSTTKPQSREIVRKEKFEIGDMRLGQLLAKWVGITDEDGHKWTLEEIETRFYEVHPDQRPDGSIPQTS